MQNIYESNLSHVINRSAIEVHKHLGPGLLEFINRVLMLRTY